MTIVHKLIGIISGVNLLADGQARVEAKLGAILANQARILANQAKELQIMGQLADSVQTLSDNVTKIGTSLTNLASAVQSNDAQIQQEIQALTAALGNSPDPDVAAAVQKIGDLSAQLATQAQAIDTATSSVVKETSDLAASLPKPAGG